MLRLLHHTCGTTCPLCCSTVCGSSLWSSAARTTTATLSISDTQGITGEHTHTHSHEMKPMMGKYANDVGIEQWRTCNAETGNLQLSAQSLEVQEQSTLFLIWWLSFPLPLPPRHPQANAFSDHVHFPHTRAQSPLTASLQFFSSVVSDARHCLYLSCLCCSLVSSLVCIHGNRANKVLTEPIGLVEETIWDVMARCIVHRPT